MFFGFFLVWAVFLFHGRRFFFLASRSTARTTGAIARTTLVTVLSAVASKRSAKGGRGRKLDGAVRGLRRRLSDFDRLLRCSSASFLCGGVFAAGSAAAWTTACATATATAAAAAASAASTAAVAACTTCATAASLYVGFATGRRVSVFFCTLGLAAFAISPAVISVFSASASASASVSAPGPGVGVSTSPPLPPPASCFADRVGSTGMVVCVGAAVACVAVVATVAGWSFASRPGEFAFFPEVLAPAEWEMGLRGLYLALRVFSVIVVVVVVPGFETPLL